MIFELMVQIGHELDAKTGVLTAPTPERASAVGEISPFDRALARVGGGVTRHSDSGKEAKKRDENAYKVADVETITDGWGELVIGDNVEFDDSENGENGEREKGGETHGTGSAVILPDDGNEERPGSYVSEGENASQHGTSDTDSIPTPDFSDDGFADSNDNSHTAATSENEADILLEDSMEVNLDAPSGDHPDDASEQHGDASVGQNPAQTRIPRELALNSHLFSCPSLHPFRMLDLCLAPGGYSRAVQLLNPSHSIPIDGITLSPHAGGHNVRIPHNTSDPTGLVTVQFLDIAELALEFGPYWARLNQHPPHPDRENFLASTPFLAHRYDLVMCDGQVLRGHRGHASYHLYSRETKEIRLRNAQLVIALRRIKEGGSMVVLLHKLDEWETLKIVKAFSEFSNVQLFKPAVVHAKRSSFYLVAKNVRAGSEEAKRAVEEWSLQWFLRCYRRGDIEEEKRPGETEKMWEVMEVLEEFGGRLRELGKEIWEIQAEALEKAPFQQENRKHAIRNLQNWRT